MSRLRSFALLSVLLLLTGCAAEGISISDEDRALMKCSGIEMVAVESLDDSQAAPCDLAGIEVAFPDGFSEIAPELGTSRAASSSEKVSDLDETVTYSMWNIGIDGLVAARTNFDGTRTDWWGTAEGVRRVQDAFGDPSPIQGKE